MNKRGFCLFLTQVTQDRITAPQVTAEPQGRHCWAVAPCAGRQAFSRTSALFESLFYYHFLLKSIVAARVPLTFSS